MAEPADAQDLKSCEGYFLRVGSSPTLPTTLLQGREPQRRGLRGNDDGFPVEVTAEAERMRGALPARKRGNAPIGTERT